jgi:DNA helicase-2/ATP-dependent DNA helicase PcrA
MKIPKKVAPTNPLLENLNAEQLRAVTFGNGPLLIVAGAGTGKTTVITRRIAYLVSQGAMPGEILALTFTEKAATEMEERVDVLLPYGYHDLWVSTFHAFCERILRTSAIDIGIPNDFKLLDTTQQKILVRRNLEKFNLDYYRPLGNPTKFIGELVKHFSKLKDEEITPAEYLAYAEKLKLDADSSDFVKGDDNTDAAEIQRVAEVANAYHVYEKLLQDSGSLDFGSLINCTLTLFRTRPKILSQYQRKFHTILVDEFQDTNFAQYELVKLLAARSGNLNVVGDDDQSIYKFRGASISNILQFKRDYPASTEVTLNQNYRSVQPILDLAYSFIQANNPQRLEATLKVDKNLHSNVPGQGSIAVLSGQTGSDEVDLVTKKIIALQRADAESTWNDFAILVRANDQADPFVAKLSSLNVPYTYVANRGLYKKSIILDILAYLSVLLNHDDSASLYRVLNTETFRISHDDLVAITSFGKRKALSLYEGMGMAATITGISPASLTKIQSLLSLIGTHSTYAQSHTVVEVFIQVVRDLKIADRIDENTAENVENRDVLNQFYKKVESFESDSDDRSTRAFLDALDFEQQSGEEGKLAFDPNQGPESVKIMTVHAAKGLEFKYVFIVGMVHLRFPSIGRADAIEVPVALVKEKIPDGDIDVHLQEERRLFYVAATRAKCGLFFSYALDYGGARTRKPSQFLVDIGLVAKPEKSTEVMRKEHAIAHTYDASAFLPNVFSYTQVSDFRRCPMSYKYRYLLKLPMPGNAYLSFGQTIHKTLEVFLKSYRSSLELNQLDLFSTAKPAGALPTEKELLEIYERSWVDEWYADKKQKAEYRALGRKILKGYHARFVKEPSVPKYIEEKFTLQLGKYKFVGKIDRAELHGDGKLYIVDYKTGETVLKPEKKKDDRTQLLIYQMAAEQYLKEQVGGLSYWFLVPDQQTQPFVGTADEIDELKAGITQTIEEIRSAAAHNTFRQLDDLRPEHRCQFQDLE